MRISLQIHYFIVYFLFCYMHALPAIEYIYPVASLNDGTEILCIHQHSPTNIELLVWNTATHQSEQILWSVFNPAGLQILPDNSGFSFIDNGRLRIKSFQKRSPKAIDFDEPLFGINGLQWIDNHICCCSAQYNNNFALFELHDDGTLECLMTKEGKDFMCPQKVGGQLFYIERYATEKGCGDIHYHIASCLYEKKNSCFSQSNIIADFQNKPIMFLTMVDDTQGFVMEHAQHINSENPTTSFTYHQIIKEGGTWNQKPLFSFAIPTTLLLDDQEQLYESILPLLPRTINNKIYFVDCAKNNNHILELYSYDLAKSTVKKINLAKQKGHCFVPVLCGNAFYCGGFVLRKI